jgi:Trp operon repressor
MQSYWTYLALDAAERTREADRHRLAALARRDGPDRSIRHRVAVAVATISRLSAGLVRRLDECVADDLASTIGTPSPTAH